MALFVCSKEGAVIDTNQIKRLYLLGKTYQEIADTVKEPRNKIRETIRRSDYYHPKPHPSNQYQTDLLPEFLEMKADGSQISDRVLRLTAQQRIDKRQLMEAHGYDPNQWDVINVKSNLWHGPSPGGPIPYYQSKITLKPKHLLLDIDHLINRIATIKPIAINTVPFSDERSGLLEVFLSDQHFGLDNDYSGTLRTVIDEMRTVDTVVMVIGSDGIHVDNVSNTTVKGTQLEPIDLNQAWSEMYHFYFQCNMAAVTLGIDLHVKYIPGNHDSTIAWTVLKALQQALPNANYDISQEHFKAFRYHDVALGWTHGDTGKKTDFDRLFHRRFPDVFGTALCKEVHYGHIHTETVIDRYGTIVRSLPTGTVASDWTVQSGYDSVRTFQLFKYSTDRLTAIHYV